MSAIQDLAPFIGAYQGKIRRAKDASAMTLEELSNESGVSFSAVSRLYAGTQVCLLLSFTLIACLVTDAQIRNAGLIRDGDLTVTAWACIALIVGSVLASAITFYAIRKERGGKHGVHQV